MAKRAISDNTTAQAARLRRMGLSFRAIGEALGIDPRTAKALAARVDDAEERQHWEEVTLHVDARLLEEHYRMLFFAAAGVLRAVEVDHQEASSSLEAQSWLQFQVGAALVDIEGVLRQRGIMGGDSPLGDVQVDESVASRLLAALSEHEPLLAAALEGPRGWKSLWRRFQQGRLDIVDQARGLLGQRGLTGKQDQGLAESAVEVALAEGAAKRESEWPGLAAASSRRAPVPARFIDNGREARRGTHMEDEAVRGTFGWVLSQISVGARVGPLLQEYAALQQAALQVADAVRILQLRGRPSGRCGLCPSSRGGALEIPRSPKEQKPRAHSKSPD